MSGHNKARPHAGGVRPGYGVMGWGLFFGVGEDGGGLDVDAQLTGAGEDGAGEAGLEIFGAVAEVGFGGSYVLGVGHGVFSSLGEPKHAVGQLFSFFGAKSVVHSNLFE